jgi:hypothetical protein
MARNKPLPRKQRVINRGFLYSRQAEKDKTPNISVGLMDIDSAIIFYFENVIKPSVEDNGENVKVPIMYSSPERWKAILRDGFMRDKKRQLIIPVITFKRITLERDDTVPQDKLDANNPHLFYTFEKKFSNINRYDNFTQQIGLIPQKEYYNVTFPDYVTITYDFIVWTTYIEQMNKIVERINYSAGAYWGDPDKMRFRTQIDSFSDATEMSDIERFVKTNFTVTLRGYLLPEANFDHRSTTQKYLTPKKVIFGTETDVAISKPVGTAGQFLDEESTEVKSLGRAAEQSSLAVALDNPLIITQGTGVTVSNTGAEFDGSSRLTQQISIGQPVTTTSDVIFNQISGSSLLIGGVLYNSTGISSSIYVTGSVTTTGDLTVGGNATIAGILTAEEFHTEFVSSSIVYSSGSTKFGDDTGDSHTFTGSLGITGSLSLNDSSAMVEFSNDTSLGDSSATAIVTENAAKTYIDDQTSSQNTYFRKTFVKTSASITTATASFTAVTASAPSGLTSTGENDFVFFVNGQYMEHDAIAIEQSGSTLLLKVDNSSIGYDLESDDEILAWGKFNS